MANRAIDAVKRPCFKIESAFAQPLAGVDEAGCAPLAGPVVAGAVVLDRDHFPRGIDDSKKLDLETREAIFGRLQKVARIGVGIASVEEIDTLNIYWARMLAMQRAVAALGFEPAFVLVDGNRLPRWERTQAKAIVAGDTKCRSIAAASIVAKVTRDRIMCALHEEFPDYGWITNMGYGTRAHCAALTALGVTPHHRRSFAPVRAALAGRLSHADLSVYNAVQKLLYLGVILCAIVIVLSGISIWKPIQLRELSLLFGGYDAARFVHFFAMAAIVGFIVIHVLMAFLVPKSLRAMIIGR